MKRLKVIPLVCATALLVAGCGSGGGDREFGADGSPSGTTTAVDAVKALQLRIGTGNEIRKISGPDPEAAPVYNEVPYGVIVTDVDGNPVAGVDLKSFVVSLDYRTGLWFWNSTSTPPQWQPTLVDTCMGEDTNENLVRDLNPDEDKNGDGQLTPGNVATAFFGETGEALLARTDDKGSAILRVRYPRDRNYWVQVKIRVIASIPSGTEAVEERVFWLPVLSEDLTDAAVPPPGDLPGGQPGSPYGMGLCPVGTSR